MQTDQDPGKLLATFLDTTFDLTRELDTEKALIAIVERAMDLTGARYGAAVTLDQNGAIDSFQYRGLTPDQVALLPHLPEGKGLLGVVLMERRTVRLERLQDHPESVGFPDKHVAMHAFLGVPLIHHDQLVGALYLTKGPGMEPFSEADEGFFQSMAAIGAVGISNARLYTAEYDRAERGALMAEIASKVRRSLDMKEVLSTTVTTLGKAAQVDRCFIRLAQDEDRLSGITYEWDSPGTAQVQGRDDVPLPVSALAAVERKTTWSDDIMEDDRLQGDGGRQGVLEAQTRAVLAAPLEWGDELLGVVAFHSRTPRNWTEADIALIEAAAREVSIALNHARRFTEAVQTAEKLRQVDQLRSDFVAMVSHELRSPMTVVAGIADILKKRGGALTSQQINDLIDTLGREARRLTRLVSEVLDLEAIEQGAMELQIGEVDTAGLARDAVTDAGASDRTDLVVGRGNAVVMADADRVKQVLLNLISNAVKFTDDPSSLIEVKITPETDSVLISVKDQGPGISEDDQGRLFQRFMRLEGVTRRKAGSGLGLYLSRSIIEAHGGGVWVESQVGRGSTFSFRIPRNVTRR